MNAASPAAQQVRRNAAMPSRPAAAAAMRPAPAFADDEPELRVNLSDVPLVPATMEVEGFRPTLLSRLFDLFSPNR